MLGDDFDLALRDAQRNSRVSVILVSESTDRAFYQREEIAAAIALARARGTAHRVVPVYVGAIAATSGEVPYGLRLKHGLVVGDLDELGAAAGRLLELVEAPGSERGGGEPEMEDAEWRRLVADRARRRSDELRRALAESADFIPKTRAELTRRATARVRIRAEGVGQTGSVVGIEGLPLDRDADLDVEVDVRDVEGRATGIRGADPPKDQGA